MLDTRTSVGASRARGAAIRLFASVLTAGAAVAHAQTLETPQNSTPEGQAEEAFHPAPVYLDSGPVSNDGPGLTPSLVFSGQVHVTDAMWVRLHFEIASLAGERGDANASFVVLTSVLDGASQVLYTEDLEDWSMSSAYFNGDRVRVDLYGQPGAGPSRVRVTSVEYGEPGWLDRSLCGMTDDRVPSSDPASGRLLPSMCTAWLVGDLPNGLLTAGHCAVGAGAVVEFNVPASTIGGSMQHPSPEHQYPVDPASLQAGSGTTGHDWLFFGVFDNSETGLSPQASQGASHQLAEQSPPNDGRAIRVSGYGQVTQPMPLQYNFIQLTHTGPLIAAGNTQVRYQVDTSGGDSGAAVIDETTGLAIGVHTNGGCNSDGWNRGTSTREPTLRAALAEPIGWASNRDPVEFEFFRGRPAEVRPDGSTVLRVRIRPSQTREPMAGTAVLHVFDGSGWIAVPMTHVNGSVYRASFPAIDGCVARVRYYVSVMNDREETNVSPAGAPVRTYWANVASPRHLFALYDFGDSIPWQIQSSAALSTGAWTMAVPPSIPRRGPVTDFDGNGKCLLTGAGLREDVDGGPTVAMSPSIALPGATDPYVSFAAWQGSTLPSRTPLQVEASADGGRSWRMLESISLTDGWEHRVYRLSDYFADVSQVKLAFVVQDAPNEAIVESAIDRLMIFEPECVECPADLTGDGVVEFADLAAFLNDFSAEVPGADVNGDGAFDTFDVIAFLDLFSQGCE